MNFVNVATVVLLVMINGTFGVDLDIISRLFVPTSYDPGPVFDAEDVEGTVEQLAYDPKRKLVYTVGKDKIHVVDINDVDNPTILEFITVTDADITDVEVCGDFVYTTNNNKANVAEGFVDVYSAYTSSLDRVQRITVGNVPDMLQLTRNCRKILVAIEAIPVDNDSTSSLDDTPGAVVIVQFNGPPTGTYRIKTLTFERFNSEFSRLEAEGARHIYRENGNTFANDIEPEYITINKKETRAYVSLQENNAIATVDLKRNVITKVNGLGYKQWNDSLIDPSNRDSSVGSGINRHKYNILGMYQPDAIKVFKFHGYEYIIAAAEGDAKDYEYFSEEERIKDRGLSDVFEPNLPIRDVLDTDELLGRLRVTNTQGINPVTNKYDTVYSYGARSFAIFRAYTMDLVYDSGSELSEKLAEAAPILFNSRFEAGETLTDTFDSRSDDKGIEPESLELVDISRYITLVFLGVERPGLIYVYSIDKRLPTIQPQFETLFYDIPTDDPNANWSDLYDNKQLSMNDCEDIRFIPAKQSPNGEDLLIATGTASGTVTLIKVDTSSLGEYVLTVPLFLTRLDASAADDIKNIVSKREMAPIGAISLLVAIFLYY